VLIDIYSRYVPGWMLAHAENARLAEALLADTIAKQHIARGQLTLHADRGSPMTAKPVAFLLADLGVTKSHSRPHCSNDNPYSESQFRTMKYRPEFPERFGSYPDAHAFCGRFFGWYNDDHRHSGIGFHTPPTSITAAPSSCGPGGPTCSRPPTPSTPNASSASRPNRPPCRRRYGSTSHRRTPPRHSDSRTDLPQES
jgi:transposase InsO family protein